MCTEWLLCFIRNRHVYLDGVVMIYRWSPSYVCEIKRMQGSDHVLFCYYPHRLTTDETQQEMELKHTSTHTQNDRALNLRGATGKVRVCSFCVALSMATRRYASCARTIYGTYAPYQRDLCAVVGFPYYPSSWSPSTSEIKRMWWSETCKFLLSNRLRWYETQQETELNTHTQRSNAEPARTFRTAWGFCCRCMAKGGAPPAHEPYIWHILCTNVTYVCVCAFLRYENVIFFFLI